MTIFHELGEQAFAELSRGNGASAIDGLRHSQLSKRLLLLRHITRNWPIRTSERDRALAVLAAAHSTNPNAVNEFLLDPMIGSWMAWIVRRLRHSTHSTTPLPVELGHLNAIAAVAAMRANIDAELVIDAFPGQIMLPTLGCATVAVDKSLPTSIKVRSGRISIGGNQVPMFTSGDDDTAAWRGLRALAVGVTATEIKIAIDDLSPYRSRYDIPTTDRLGFSEARQWSDLFAQAWQLLTFYAPERVREIATGLRSIIPFANVSIGLSYSATSRDSFGAFGSTRPISEVDFAATIVHEFQHSKLNAVMDISPLYDASDSQTYFSPWRQDPRPIGGLYHGVYAFLGVADLWLRLRDDRRLSYVAEQQFADIREQVHRGLLALNRSVALSTVGRRFATGMQSALDDMFAVEVAQPVLTRARQKMTRIESSWKEFNGRTI